MKVLFLDIDGVLNSFDNQFAMEFRWKGNDNIKSRDKYGTLFDNRCINWLGYIIQKTSCRIVISSTWRLSGLQTLIEMWIYRNLPGQIIDITTFEVPVEIYQKYDEELAFRGYEIQDWLNKNKVKSYCIVDDEVDMLKHQKFVKTNGRIGLNYEASKNIISILNK